MSPPEPVSKARRPTVCPGVRGAHTGAMPPSGKQGRLGRTHTMMVCKPSSQHGIRKYAQHAQSRAGARPSAAAVQCGGRTAWTAATPRAAACCPSCAPSAAAAAAAACAAALPAQQQACCGQGFVWGSQQLLTSIRLAVEQAETGTLLTSQSSSTAAMLCILRPSCGTRRLVGAAAANVLVRACASQHVSLILCNMTALTLNSWVHTASLAPLSLV